jgi:hypothetical protein
MGTVRRVETIHPGITTPQPIGFISYSPSPPAYEPLFICLPLPAYTSKPDILCHDFWRDLEEILQDELIE